MAFTVTSNGGIALYMSIDNHPPVLMVNFTKDLVREHYGLPERLWVDSESNTVIMKTADKSLHMVKGSEKVWTRQEGLTEITKWAVGKSQEITEKTEGVGDFDSINPVTKFLIRVQNQASTIMTGVKKTMSYFDELITKKQFPFKATKKRIDGKYLFVSFVLI